jgi:hypothetical protein
MNYHRCMSVHIIRNPVPTPEEMGEILGISSDRVAAVRRIMGTPIQQKASGSSIVRRRAVARKKSSRTPAAAPSDATRSDAKK